jgi:hypothetical protein
MPTKIGQSSIVTDGLILALDAASPLNFTLSEVEILVVAGGGAGGGYGGNDGSGGGGAGGLVYNPSYKVTPGTPISATVGNGGAGVGGATRGNNGQNSVFGVLTAIGGGGGGSEGVTAVRPGSSGGSGGGSGGYGVNPGGSGVFGQGNAGGNCTAPGDGGGGGAGYPGGDGGTGKGGDGLIFNISGSPVFYAGGGGAGGDKRNYRGAGGGFGGLGGGGKGQNANDSVAPTGGKDGTGGGGGGAAGSNSSFGAGTTLTSGAGGRGVVIVRYPGPQKATGGTITQVGGYTIHTFNASGTFTPLSAPSNSGAVYGLQDLSGNNNSCFAVNGPTYNTLNRGCINFDGVDDYMSSTTSRKYLDITIVFRPDFSAVTSIAGIIGGAFSGDKSLRFQGVDGTGPWSVATRNPGDANDWAGIAGGATTYYVNGSVSNTLVSGWNIFGGYRTNQTTFPLEFPYHLGTSSYPGRYFKGQIAVVLMYDRRLTQAEQLQNFNALRERFGI